MTHRDKLRSYSASHNIVYHDNYVSYNLCVQLAFFCASMVALDMFRLKQSGVNL